MPSTTLSTYGHVADCFTEDDSCYILGADNEADGLPLCPGSDMDDCRLSRRSTGTRSEGTVEAAVTSNGE